MAVGSSFCEPGRNQPGRLLFDLDSKERKAYAKANCNLLNLSYVIENQSRLLFQGGSTTEIACPDDTKNRLLRALQETDCSFSKIQRNKKSFPLFNKKQVQKNC